MTHCGDMADMQRVWFADGVEGLWWKGLASRMTPQLKAQLKTVGLDLDGKIQPAYPAEVIAAASRIASKLLFPKLSEEAAFYELGTIALEQFANTLLGRALFPMLRVMGWRRALQRMQSNLRTASNYAEVTVTEVAPDCFRLTLRDPDGLAYFWKALIDVGSRHAGIPHPTSDAVLRAGETVTLFYDLRKTPGGPPFPGTEAQRWATAPALGK